MAIVRAALRTNLTLRELAAVFAISRSQTHRIVADLVPRLAALLSRTITTDRRYTWIVDGTLVPTRDHTAAAKSKNYRWSCNAQVLVRRSDLCVIGIDGGGPGNRNDPLHYRGSHIETMCRRHGGVLADGGYRGVPDLVTPIFRSNRIVGHQSANCCDDVLEPPVGLCLEQIEAPTQLVVRQCKSPQCNECPYDVDVDLDRARTAQNAGQHANAFLGECERQ